MRIFREVFGTNQQHHLMTILLVVLLLVFDAASGGRMLVPANLQNLVVTNAYMLVLALGMLMVVVIGQIDLSVGSVAAVVSMTVAVTMRSSGMDWWLGVAWGLVLGALVGAFQGFFLARVGVPGFITTLAGMLIFRGIAQGESQALSVPVPAGFQQLGAGFLPEWGPSWTGLNNSTLLVGVCVALGVIVSDVRRARRRARHGMSGLDGWVLVARAVVTVVVVGVVTWLFGSGTTGTSFPIPGVVVLVLVAFYHVLTRRTVFGRHLYAAGGNPVAAELAGVDVRRIQFLVMVNMGILAALAGMMFAGLSTAAGPQDGSGWELDAIAAVFIGGAAVGGGRGTVLGAVLGASVLAVLSNGLLLLGVGSDGAQVIRGAVLLLAVSLDVWNRYRRDTADGKRLPRSVGAEQLSSASLLPRR